MCAAIRWRRAVYLEWSSSRPPSTSWCLHVLSLQYLAKVSFLACFSFSYLFLKPLFSSIRVLTAALLALLLRYYFIWQHRSSDRKLGLLQQNSEQSGQSTSPSPNHIPCTHSGNTARHVREGGLEERSTVSISSLMHDGIDGTETGPLAADANWSSDHSSPPPDYYDWYLIHEIWLFW